MTVRNGKGRYREKQHPTDPALFWCPSCRAYFDKGSFTKNKRNFHGIAAYCKECSRIKQQAREQKRSQGALIRRKNINDRYVRQILSKRPTPIDITPETIALTRQAITMRRDWKKLKNWLATQYPTPIKDFRRIHQRRHARTNPDNPSQLWCPLCETFKDAELFPRDNNATDGRYSYCKECANKKSKEYNHTKRRIINESKHKRVDGKQRPDEEAV